MNVPRDLTKARIIAIFSCCNLSQTPARHTCCITDIVQKVNRWGGWKEKNHKNVQSGWWDCRWHVLFYTLLNFKIFLQSARIMGFSYLSSIWSGPWVKSKPATQPSQGRGMRKQCKGPVVKASLYSRNRKVGQRGLEGLLGTQTRSQLGIWLWAEVK